MKIGEMRILRYEISSDYINRALLDISNHTSEELKKKGYGTFSSIYEILGCITEEYLEVIEAIHKNSHEDLKEELLDVATACQFAIACINNKTLDW
jgi:NTP pyrophosphatase (non-canonical NTP hydrolase)